MPTKRKTTASKAKKAPPKRKQEDQKPEEESKVEDSNHKNNNNTENNKAEEEVSAQTTRPAKKAKVVKTATTKAERIAELKKKLRKIDWKNLDVVGIEIEGKDSVYKEKWDFSELEREITTGELAKREPLYMFMGAQPISIKKEKEEGETVINVPYIIVIDCAKPPSGRIAVTSIQLAEELIVPAQRLNMSWVPYIPKDLQNNVELPVQIIALKWESRKDVIKHMSAEQKHKTSFRLPYELLPQIFEQKTLDERLKEVVSVSFAYKATTGKTIEITWDKTCMNTHVDVDPILEDEGLPETEKPLIVAKLKEEFNAARERETKRYNQEKEELAKLSAKDADALRKIKLYKFYPTHPSINLRPYMDPTINRYYGKAHKVFPSIEEAKKVEQFTFVDPLANVNPAATGFSFGAPALAAASAAVGFAFGASAPAAPAATGFVFGAPSTQPASAPAATGFVFGASSSNTSTSNSSKWTCKACNTSNEGSAKVCSTCMVPKA